MFCFIFFSIIIKVNHILRVIFIAKSKTCIFYEKKIKRLLKEQPFYNVSIEKPKIRKLNNVDMLNELPFYDELTMVKTTKAFKKYARSYNKR